jgi:hypothetical protein
MGDHHDHEMENMEEHGAHDMMDEEHTNSMFAILFFMWHLIFALCLMIGISCFIYFLLKKRGKLDPEFFKNNTTDSFLNNNDSKGYAKLENGYEKTQFDKENSTPLLEAVSDDENVLYDNE